MKISTNNSQKPFLSIVACQHGDEPFGLEIIHALASRLNEFPGLVLIVANEEALAMNRRGIDGDLNRSFPGDPSGNHEERLAHQLIARIRPSDFVLDIHTSVSHCGRLLPILTKLDERSLRLVNLLDAPRLLHIQPPLADASLIGNISGGVSLEFERALADETSVQHVVKLVEDLYTGTQNAPREREAYIVTDVLPVDLPELATSQDFDFLDSHQCYPVLINRRPTLDNQGLKATHKKTVLM